MEGPSDCMWGDWEGKGMFQGMLTYGGIVRACLLQCRPALVKYNTNSEDFINQFAKPVVKLQCEILPGIFVSALFFLPDFIICLIYLSAAPSNQRVD